jgi:ubiquinone biosynthesis protein
MSDLDRVLARHSGPELAHRLIRVFLRQAMIDGFFHADLHPGNLFVAEDGAFVAVDFGIMGRLGAANSRFLALILKGFVERDYRGLARLHFEAGFVPPHRDVEAFAQALRAVGEPIFDRPVAEISMGRVLTQLFDVTRQFEMQTQPQLLLLQKTMVVVEGVARRLDPNLNMFETARPIVEEWLSLNLGPAAALNRGLAEIPVLLDRLRHAADALGPGGFRLHPESARAIAREQVRLGWRERWALYLAVLALVLAVVALI